MPQHSIRPDPDALLKWVQTEEERRGEGRLKIYFGYAPGVGKTYTMLETARRLADEGMDVVAGCVETHGRAETARLLEGLAQISPRQAWHRGALLNEFDLDAALARTPRILLLDELAHTNAPGSRHPKRWHDVLDLLDAGIEVHTTLNVQHVDSLGDVVTRITGVQVRETVPDAILERADQIELVDLSPDDLLLRLQEGRVYVPDQALRAAEHFFRRGNLLALRELSLRRAAERVDDDVRSWRREFNIQTTWPAGERILACVGPGPGSAQIIRAARRMATGLGAPWAAIHVDLGEALPLSQEDRDRLEANLRLAESLGGEVVRLRGGRSGAELIRHARRHNVTRILMGKPGGNRWRDLFKGSIVDQIVRGSGEIEVHLIAGAPETRQKSGSAQPRAWLRRWADRPRGLLRTLGLIILVTVIAHFLRGFLADADLVMAYLLIIMITAVRFGRVAALWAAALSVAAFDYCFVPPFYTFVVSDIRHLFTFAMMFAVGLTISGLVARIRRQEQDARVREERAAALHALSRELVSVLDEGQAADIVARQAREAFGGEAVVLLRGSGGALVPRGRSRADLALNDSELAVAALAGKHGRPAGLGTDTLPGSPVCCLPLRSGARVPGVLVLRLDAPLPMESERRVFMEAWLHQATLALERASLNEEAHRAEGRARDEEMRSSLLSAVSHDLRTPLAAITGAGTALRDDAGRLDGEQRAELLETICAESERMERLVGNLLDMMRLASGDLAPAREWLPLEETVGAALTRLEGRLAGRDIVLDVPHDLPLLRLDPVLFEQVLLNLLDNVLKYTPAGSPLEIRATSRGGRVVATIADRGPGLPPGAEQAAFEKFWRGAPPGVGGAGLGLPICRSIVATHGGSLEVSARPGGGAVFTISLPLEEAPATGDGCGEGEAGLGVNGSPGDTPSGEDA